MRKVVNLNKLWAFTKNTDSIPSTMPERWDMISLPHTWNAVDGTDGGNDYYRGKGYYVKQLNKVDLPEADEYYIEFCGANSVAEVFVNGESAGSHKGGYSTWRVNVTNLLKDENLIVVVVDNTDNKEVYPRFADFTFYGGLYRNVNLIAVNKTHFDLDFYGGPGIKVTPTITNEDANVEIEVFVTDPQKDMKLDYKVLDQEGNVVGHKLTSIDETDVNIEIKNVHLWNGRKDPYLYTATVTIVNNDEAVDDVTTRFGCRTYEIDPEKGFILNGKQYPLRGVSRHQDRAGFGNALLPEHHEEDIELICEVGATTIRLAHYQHDQYFYDLCDEKGLVVWAEIPYISRHVPEGRENTISQMKELITQNYNHPCIVVWGLSNEITIGNITEDLVENHHILNDLCHEMDKTRKTVEACVSMADIHSEYVHIPDVVSFNHYFGWYGGDVSMNGPWLDNFHKEYPNVALGLSEYGCEALNWHTSEPKQGDYTEEYQAYYHEEMIKQLFSRDYLWATHVWNMFDFGADARCEGGENGMNHKGLVTFDRKYKKDSFYAYKAWLSDDPFVHICGKRYVDRVEDVTKVTVYSNLPEVELFVNGESLAKQTSKDHFFYFEVPNKGVSTLVAVAGDCKDTSTIKKVEKFNESYRFYETGAILNWFDITEVEGHLSLNDTIGDIMDTKEGKMIIEQMLSKIDEATSKKAEDQPASQKDMIQMLKGFTFIRFINLMGVMNDVSCITKENLLEINKQLNKIAK